MLISRIGYKNLKGGPLTAKAKDGAVNFKLMLRNEGSVYSGQGKRVPGPRVPRGVVIDTTGNECIRFFTGNGMMRQLTILSQTQRGPFQLDILSTLRPEIVMTGIRERHKERKIVGLYDNE
jgi:hypothetical protein